jgi:hypothetical protein
MIPHQVVLQNEFPHKSVNLSFTITDINNNLTDSYGNGLLQDDLKNTLCERKNGIGAGGEGMVPHPAIGNARWMPKVNFPTTPSTQYLS